jgi:hypothetical protein
VKRSILLALAAALLALGLLAGCGDDDGDGGNGGSDPAAQKEEFDKAYKPINDEVVSIGEDVAQTIQTAKGQSDQALATKFGELSSRVLEQKDRMTDLETPPEYKADVDRLAASLDVVAGDLREISEAAENHEAAEAKTQVQELVRHSVETRTARRALARKTGAKV